MTDVRTALPALWIVATLAPGAAWSAEAVQAAAPAPTAVPIFTIPQGPDDSPTVTAERIITGSVGGLLAGFGIGMAAGIVHYNWSRRNDPTQATLTDGALSQGLRYGGAGAFTFLLVFGGYSAYSAPRPAVPEIYPFMDRPRAAKAGEGAGSSEEPLAVAVAKTGEFLRTHPVPWISGVDLDGERLLVRVGTDYDAAALPDRRKSLSALFAAYQAARRAQGLPAAGEMWLRGTAFLERWAPPSE